jgi:hypothetical protein
MCKNLLHTLCIIEAIQEATVRHHLFGDNLSRVWEGHTPRWSHCLLKTAKSRMYASTLLMPTPEKIDIIGTSGSTWRCYWGVGRGCDTGIDDHHHHHHIHYRMRIGLPRHHFTISNRHGQHFHTSFSSSDRNTNDCTVVDHQSPRRSRALKWWHEKWVMSNTTTCIPRKVDDEWEHHSRTRP